MALNRKTDVVLHDMEEALNDLQREMTRVSRLMKELRAQTRDMQDANPPKERDKNGN